jgi:predicted DNA-binding ribbon-helix-helix protein
MVIDGCHELTPQQTLGISYFEHILSFTGYRLSTSSLCLFWKDLLKRVASMQRHAKRNRLIAELADSDKRWMVLDLLSSNAA